MCPAGSGKSCKRRHWNPLWETLQVCHGNNDSIGFHFGGKLLAGKTEIYWTLKYCMFSRIHLTSFNCIQKWRETDRSWHLMHGWSQNTWGQKDPGGEIQGAAWQDSVQNSASLLKNYAAGLVGQVSTFCIFNLLNFLYCNIFILNDELLRLELEKRPPWHVWKNTSEMGMRHKLITWIYSLIPCIFSFLFIQLEMCVDNLFEHPTWQQ